MNFDPKDLQGSGQIIDWFGCWPSFHDGEIVSLHLRRINTSTLEAYPYYPQKPASVLFHMDGITDLELADFSIQNVMSDLIVETCARDSGQVFRIVLGPCYGLAGWIECKELRVELAPGPSSDRGSLWP